ncbi:Fe2+ transport protein FeoA, partial [Dysosmobacter welbionis]
RALRIVEQQVRLQGLEAEPMGRLRTQLMGQVHPLVLGGLQLFDLLPQCQIRHNVFPPFHVTGYACLQTRYASR